MKETIWKKNVGVFLEKTYIAHIVHIPLITLQKIEKF